MSHGEAWDQPMIEAGATGLRLIAPKHSAYTAYLDEAIARLIPARRVPARFDAGAGLGRLFEGAEWWEPDEEAAAEAVHEAVSGADRDCSTTRARLAAEFTWERAAARLITIREELHGCHGLRF